MPDRGRDPVAFDLHAEAHGVHWVAWIRQADGKPKGSIILVGQTRDEAEARARQWAEELRARGEL